MTTECVTASISTTLTEFYFICVSCKKDHLRKKKCKFFYDIEHDNSCFLKNIAIFQYHRAEGYTKRVANMKIFSMLSFTTHTRILLLFTYRLSCSFFANHIQFLCNLSRMHRRRFFSITNFTKYSTIKI